MTRLLPLLAWTAFAAAVPAQKTYIVSAAGGGHFTEIAPALAAAQAGDTILVRPGQYLEFTADKGVRLIGEPGVSVGSLLYPYSIANVPTGETLVVRGIAPGNTLFSGRIDVSNCDGHVHLESIPMTGGLSIANSRQVSLHDLQITGSIPAALDVVDSTVVVTESHITAKFGFSRPVPGVLCVRSNVVIAETRSTGAPAYITGAGPGVHLTSGQVTIAGDATTQIASAAFGTGLGAESAIIVESGKLILEEAVTLTPIAPFPPITNHGGTVVQTQVASFTASVASQQLTVRLHAPSATLVGLLGGPALTPSLPTPFGELWIGPAHLAMDLGPVDGNGVRTTTIQLPVLPVGAELAMQWVVLRGGSVELSTPLVRTLDG